jgi:anhydro-N-acetylmuramic acid kinase
MSGTSMDGIDAALVETDGQAHINVIERRQLRYSDAFRHLLKATEYAAQQAQGNEKTIRSNFTPYVKTYAQQYGDQERSKDENQLLKKITNFCEQANVPLAYDTVKQLSTMYHSQLIAEFANVELIAYHGQTLFHEPTKQSLQMGSPEDLFEKFQCHVVSQFRQADIDAGGQGAPLAPVYHYALCQREQLIPAVVVNCGGIANVTVVGESYDQLIGFDTGPGNVLLDRYIRRERQLHMDEDGKFSQQGTLQPKLLDALLSKACKHGDYFQRPPPKSLDSYDFILIEEIEDYNFFDVCKTLAHFTALTIVNSVLALDIKPKHWILCGGGWKNPAITAALREYLAPHQTLLTPTDLGWSNDYLEAELMAYLGVRRLFKLPSTFPSTTGAIRPTVCGQLMEGVK